MARKEWIVSPLDKDLASEISERYAIDPFAALLLTARGVTREEEVLSFLREDAPLRNPFELKDMDKAVAEINRALNAGEKIAVFGDYDADGVTASSLLFLYLEMLGAEVVCYIPDRNSEGYGLNPGAVRRLHDDGVQLIVTVDNGISAIPEAELIYELGMRLVVTDHHRVGKQLPRAEAVVDPHRPDCPSTFKDLAGVGVAFKLICALSGDTQSNLDEFADLICIGTIGDVVSLTDENRVLVRSGLKKLNENHNYGLAALRGAAGAADKDLTANSVAFSIVPRINAVGRIDRADKAFELLISDQEAQAEAIARDISALNAERQSLEQQIMREAEKQMETDPAMRFARVLIFDGAGWHGGVIGIVAARLVERYGKPCIVITSDGDESKGSGRSLDGFSLYDAIFSVSDLLTHFGGHPLAAGFGIRTADIPEFKKRINDYAKSIDMPFPQIRLDCKLRPAFISGDLFPVIATLEPFGAGNPQPTFGLFDVTLRSVQPLSGGKHLRLSFSKGDVSFQALRFGVTPDRFPYHAGDRLDLAVRLEPNEYMGVRRVSIYIKDIRMTGTDDLRFLKSVRLYEKIRRGDPVSRRAAAFALPDRTFVADVFRYIRKIHFYEDDLDVLCYRLDDDGAGACKVLMSLAALTELGVLVREPDGRYRVDPSKKADLETSEILNQLKRAAGAEE
ncbi:MAG: single-stranded-DNA-specific exonuclease RecJ [Clostridia bacterium]|nr:single-stranded-DNA-specific exonuclease RecJ [Clostridia bacterium]